MKTVGVAHNSIQIAFCAILLKTIEQELAILGFQADVANSELDISLQLTQFENLISKKVDAIILLANNSVEIVSHLKMAREKDIPVVAVDIMPASDEKDLLSGYVATDNFRAGELAGEYIAWKLQGEGKLALLEFNEISPGIDRRNGLRNIIRHFPGIEIIAEERAMTVPLGMSVTEAVLKKHSDLDAVWCVNDDAGIGALRTIQNSKLEKKVFVVATDGNPRAVDEIRNGSAYKMTVAQFPVLIARYTVQMVSALLSNKEIPSNIDRTVIPTWYTPIMPVTADNWNQYPGWRGVIPTTLMMPWWK